MSKLNVLRNVIVISLAETSLWTGRAKMTAEDLGLEADDVPPDAIASLGSKRVIDQDAIKPLNKIRYKMRRACLEVGTRFVTGFAVGLDESEELVRKLNGLVKEGEMVKKTFMATLATRIKQWHDQNPNWKHILSAGTPELDRIERKINFGFQAYLVQAPENPEVAANFLGAVDAMGSGLVDEIVKEARVFVKQSLKDGREAGSQKTVAPMRRVARKIEALKFVDPTLSHIGRVVNAVLATIPETGKVQADAFLNLCRLANMLADRGRFQQVASSLKDRSMTLEQVLIDLIGKNAVDTKVAMAASPNEQPPIAAGTEPLMAHELFGQDAGGEETQVDPEVLQAVREITGTTPVSLNQSTAVTAPVYDGVDF